MANSHNDFKPRRSRRSGVKKMKLIKANLAILKKLAALFIIVLFAACTPVKYVMVDPKDSTKLVEIRKRIIYDDYHMSMSPLLYNNYWWYNSRPIIIQRQPIVIPQRPRQPLPPRGPRSFGPLPPTPRPKY